MAYTDKTLKDGAGADFTAPVWTPGRDAASASSPVAIDNESKASLDLTASRLAGATTATLVNASAGAAFAPLAAGACRAVYIENNRTGAVDLELRRGGAGGTRVVPAGSWCYVDAVTDASQLQLKRLDGVASSVTVSTELRS